MRSVYVAVLAYGKVIHTPTVLSLFEAMNSVIGENWKFSLFFSEGDSLISRARNTIVTEFLKSGDDDLVMIDDDVSWETGAMVRLLKHPVDLVAGLYPGRAEPEQYPVRIVGSKRFIVADPETGLLEVEAVPTGFLRITRTCGLKMCEAYRDREYHDDKLDGKLSIDLFGHGLNGKRYWGEDFAFCRRWADIGGKVWADPEIMMGHTGLKTFKGRFGDFMRGMAHYSDAAKEYLEHQESMKVAAE